jgi:hypothetical protein
MSLKRANKKKKFFYRVRARAQFGHRIRIAVKQCRKLLASGGPIAGPIKPEQTAFYDTFFHGKRIIETI